jgi:hypothetical protein
MELTVNIIKSIASLFSVDELQTKIRELTLQLLENPDQIVSASTGAGASYSKQINATPAELIELFSLALEYKQTGAISAGGNNIMQSITFFTF